MEYADFVYELSQEFPPNDRFELTSQLRRAAVSIASNIAEGSARRRPDFCRFLGYASGSLYEVVTQAAIAARRGYLDASSYAELYRQAEAIARMLSGLRRSLEE